MQALPLSQAATLSRQDEAAEISGIPPEIAAIILVAGVLVYALVNAVEIAIASVNRHRIRALAKDGSVAARSVQSLLERQDHFFAFIVLLQNIGVVLASTMGGFLAADTIGGIEGVIFGTIIMTLGIALFGEITPKVLASHSGERFPLIVGPIVRVMMVATRPLIIVLAALPGYLSRLIFGDQAGESPSITEAELRLLVDIGAEEGGVAEGQAELLTGVFAFADAHLNDVMVARNEVVWVPASGTIGEFMVIYRGDPHSRYPLFDKSHDDVVGVVSIKDLLLAMANNEVTMETPVRDVSRPPLFLPESKLASEALADMREAGHQLVVAVDEYGGTAGIVTLEMLVEEVVGYVADELSRQQSEIQLVEEGTYLLQGTLTIREANDELGVALPENDDYTTVAGLILYALGHIPASGERVAVGDVELAAKRVDGSRIEEVTLRRL